MSRVEKYRKERRNKRQARALTEAEGVTEGPMPPRKAKYPSSRYKFTQWFYRFLIVLFVSLVVFLFMYGRKATESARELWTG